MYKFHDQILNPRSTTLKKTRPDLKPTIYHTQEEHASHYTTTLGIFICFTFCIDILHLCRIDLWILCFLVCHICLRVTMTSLTQSQITGYLHWALIWIGHFFVYHTCKKVCFTYEYVIKRYIHLV